MSNKKEVSDFRNWVARNRYGTYNGIEITPTSVLVSYTYVISFIIITYRKSTRYYFLEAEKKEATRAKILCNLCNLVCGWWGIPWGPIWTIKETICNIANSNKCYWGQFAGRDE